MQRVGLVCDVIKGRLLLLSGHIQAKQTATAGCCASTYVSATHLVTVQVSMACCLQCSACESPGLEASMQRLQQLVDTRPQLHPKSQAV